MKTFLTTVLSAAALIFVAGCQQAPEAQLEAARQALATADSVEADLYVSDLYLAALDSFNAAQSSIEVEDGKSGFGRDYTYATNLLTFTEQTALDAAAQVEERKLAVAAEADSLISLAQAALAAQPTGAASTVTDAGTPAVAVLVNDAVAARDMGDFVTARSLAQSALDRLAATPTPAEQPAPRS